MSWKYSQSKAAWYDPAGSFAGPGYSGCGEGLNNPAMQSVRRVGPIPRGAWRIVRLIRRHPKLGPTVLVLEPVDGAKVFGRSDFRIHGDSLIHPGEASEGCPVAGPALRARIWESRDHDLEVIE